MSSLSQARAGAVAVAPMLIGVVPFGLVAGAAPVAEGLGPGVALGLSTIVFAGASQLATVDILGNGGSAVVAVLAAWTINLRMVLYSASLAPCLSHESTLRRMAAAYLLNDQAYALSVARWSDEGGDPEGRLAYYVGVGSLLWVAWVASTLVGALVGGAVPEEIPFDFVVPLVFLVLLVPVLTTRPALAAAGGGGVAAVVAAELGAGPLSIIVGAMAGIALGCVVDAAAGGDRRLSETAKR
ncbi:MAG TPA: AzlC family ABC transporter permease [Acidimicrobiales bacterium]|nr:AzlC family ABC transporter permease [Acidimicrobiales bacterium]